MLRYIKLKPTWNEIISSSKGEEGDVKIMTQFYSTEEADNIYNKLTKHKQKNKDPSQHKIKIMGKEITIPRLQCSYGDDGLSYKYSGTIQKSKKWNKLYLTIKKRIETELKHTILFNFVLVNYYRNGNDYIGAHSDDENDLINNHTIASLSFGETRKMIFKHKKKKFKKKEIYLTHGSIVIMSGDTQKNWTHEITKSPSITNDRWNLTYRQFKIPKKLIE